MREFASRYQRLSVQDAGFLYLEHAGLPQHVAILAVAEGGPLHDPDGRLRLDALRQQLGGRLQLVPRLRQRGLWDGLCLRLVGRTRPLWELWLVAGLANGRVGLLLKLHHSLADGLAAVQLAGLLLDGTADAPSLAPRPWQPRPAPSGWALVADNLAGRAAALAA